MIEQSPCPTSRKCSTPIELFLRGLDGEYGRNEPVRVSRRHVPYDQVLRGQERDVEKRPAPAFDLVNRKSTEDEQEQRRQTGVVPGEQEISMVVRDRGIRLYGPVETIPGRVLLTFVCGQSANLALKGANIDARIALGMLREGATAGQRVGPAPEHEARLRLGPIKPFATVSSATASTAGIMGRVARSGLLAYLKHLYDAIKVINDEPPRSAIVGAQTLVTEMSPLGQEAKSPCTGAKPELSAPS